MIWVSGYLHSCIDHEHWHFVVHSFFSAMDHPAYSLFFMLTIFTNWDSVRFQYCICYEFRTQKSNAKLLNHKKWYIYKLPLTHNEANFYAYSLKRLMVQLSKRCAAH
uniref:Uncharacterized protein n=1 Tax=Oryza brachyantha TaxID=4533 RepID=J3L7G7_ORYBR